MKTTHALTALVAAAGLLAAVSAGQAAQPTSADFDACNKEAEGKAGTPSASPSTGGSPGAGGSASGSTGPGGSSAGQGTSVSGGSSTGGSSAGGGATSGGASTGGSSVSASALNAPSVSWKTSRSGW